MDVELKPNEMTLLEQAARTALDKILATSIKKRKEYGGMIYKKDKSFVPQPPITQDMPTTVDVGQDEPNCGCPAGTQPVAYYHTHPTYSVGGVKADYEILSDEDKEVAKAHKIYAFVGTLTGSFLRYDYHDDSVTPLRGGLKNTTR